MNEKVNFEIAKLLKDKGFKQPCFYYYDKNAKLNEPYLENGSSTDVEFRVDLTDLLENHNSYLTQYISAPTIAEVVMWLYEKYGIWISIDIRGDYFKLKIINKKSPIGDGYLSDCNGNLLNSPTEAYESAIYHILKNLI